VLVAAAEYVADDATLDSLRRYAENGGHLVIGIRTGYGDELARARRAVAPDRLSSAAGVWYDEFTNLASPVPVRRVADGFDLESGAAGTAWADVLISDSAEVLASFAETETGASPAITSRAYGLGRVTYVGTVPNPALSRSLARWLTPDRSAALWRAELPLGVAGGTSAGHTITFIHNWSKQPHAVTVPIDSVEVETGTCYQAGASYTVEARAVAVFQSSGAVRRSDHQEKEQ
jgi:beta-galactosidase